ncbi:MAG TPA: sugar ABC transporter permease [Candidatus Binatia bacterium]|jgi:ABC-type sugar transport system permease subunit|nr:sugar ABC transporter permease [Candidatus Binatia bacterium]
MNAAALPLVAYLVLFLVYPTIYAVRLAFTDEATGAFPSLDAFHVLATDGLFWRALMNNALLPPLIVGLEIVSGLALALLLSARLPARRWLRAAIIVPFALPEIVFLAIARHVLAPRGCLNAALAGVGIEPTAWLAPGRATAFAAVVIVDAWHTTPIVFLMLLAALAAMPADVGEAARLDGAGGLRRFAFVTLPLLAPTLAAAVLLRGVDALRLFATPLVLTGAEGVPVLSTYAYQQWSDQGSESGAAAAGLVLALLCVVASVPMLRRREIAQ